MIDITRKTKAVLNHASTDGSRQNLMGVYFDADGVQVATNGHTLARLQPGKLLDCSELLDTLPFAPSQNGHGIILASETVSQAIASIPKPASIVPSHDFRRHVVASETRPSGDLTLANPMGASMPAHEIEMKFPEYAQVLPRDEALTKAVRIDADYLLKMALSAIDAHKAANEGKAKPKKGSKQEATRAPYIDLRFSLHGPCHEHSEPCGKGECNYCDDAGTIAHRSPIVGETITIDDDKLTIVVMPMAR